MNIPVPELLPDEHEVPTHLDERVPALPALPPFDWTLRQLYGAAIAFYAASLVIPDLWDRSGHFRDNLAIQAGLWLVGGFVWILLEYWVKPRPEFWLSAWCEYLGVLLLSVPLWWRRMLPPYDLQAMHLPLATMPHWMGDTLVHGATILQNGMLHTRRRRKDTYAAAIAIQPRPNPDMLPMADRLRFIQTRLGILLTIRSAFSMQLDVRPFPGHELEVASGPSWDWIRDNVLPFLVQRRPTLVLRGPDVRALEVQRQALLTRCAQAGLPARAMGAIEAVRDLQLAWGAGGTDRVRIGRTWVVTGRRGYRSFVVCKLPRVIHLAWLRPLTSEALLCRIAFHVTTRPPGATRRSLQRRIRRWRAVDQDEDYATAEYDARRTLKGLERRQNTAATVGMYVTAPHDQALAVAEALDTAQCEFAPADVMQHRALRATQLLGHDPVGRTMNVDLRTIAATDLLATAGYWPDGRTLIGRAIGGVEPVGINLMDEDANFNWSTFVAIFQGGGKTTFGLTLAWRMANPHPDHQLARTGLQVVSVDFKASGDYAPLFDNLAARGQRASYNAWTSGPLPELNGHMGFNLSNVPEQDRGKRLLELGQRLEEWADTHRLRETPMLLLIDEILALAEIPEGASFCQRFGTQGRSLNVMPVFKTQHIAPVLKHEKAQQAFTNAGHLFLGRQNPAGLAAMVQHMPLDENTQSLLAGAPPGAGILRIERRDGAVLIGVQVEPTPWELFQFGTNPGERLARWRARAHTAGDANGRVDSPGAAGSADPVEGSALAGVGLAARVVAERPAVSNGQVGH